jgi:hypothetical protein
MCTPTCVHQHSHQNKDSTLVHMPFHNAHKQTSALLSITRLRCHAFHLNKQTFKANAKTVFHFLGVNRGLDLHTQVKPWKPV